MPSVLAAQKVGVGRARFTREALVAAPRAHPSPFRCAALRGALRLRLMGKERSAWGLLDPELEWPRADSRPTPCLG